MILETSYNCIFLFLSHNLTIESEKIGVICHNTKKPISYHGMTCYTYTYYCSMRTNSLVIKRFILQTFISTIYLCIVEVQWCKSWFAIITTSSISIITPLQCSTNYDTLSITWLLTSAVACKPADYTPTSKKIQGSKFADVRIRSLFGLPAVNLFHEIIRCKVTLSDQSSVLASYFSNCNSMLRCLWTCSKTLKDHNMQTIEEVYNSLKICCYLTEKK